MLQDLKERSQYLKTYFFDGIYRFPKKFKTLPYFDEIYSFEPSDCKKFGFIPITNFIYQESNFVKKKHTDYKYKIVSLEGDILLTHKATIGNVAKVPELINILSGKMLALAATEFVNPVKLDVDV